MNRSFQYSLILAVCIALLACGRSPDHLKLVTVVPDIATSVGQLAQTRETGKGTPIVIFEEDHSSISGQIQQGIMLTRLHDKYQMKDIVLEGYNGNNLEQAAATIRQDVARHPTSSVERIAATLVREGEISGAEYLALVYPDVRIHKGESAGGAKAAENLLVEEMYIKSRLLLAFIAIRHGVLSRVQQEEFSRKINRLIPIDSSEKLEGMVALCDPVIAKDAWTKDHDRTLFPKKSGDFVSIEKEMAAIDEVKNESKKLPSNLGELAESTDEYEKYLGARAQASKELVDATVELSTANRVPIIATIIGAAHTEHVEQLLVDANMNYAVVRSASMGSRDEVRLSSRQIYRKTSDQTVSASLFSALDGAFSPSEVARSHHKPDTVLQKEWLQAKVELYSATDDIVQALAGGGAGGGDDGGDKPRNQNGVANIPDGSLRGQFVFVDRDSIEKMSDAGKTVYVFRAVLNPGDATHAKSIWIKAAYSPLAVPPVGQTSKAEAALREAFEELPKASSGGNGGGKPPIDDVNQTSNPDGRDPSDPNKSNEEPKEKNAAEKSDSSRASEADVSTGLLAIDASQIRVSRKVTMTVADTRGHVIAAPLSL